MTLDRVTGGPAVNESLETNVPGIFACGNVLHVHDLVDYVSQEAAIAGRNAVAFVNGQLKHHGAGIPVSVSGGVRYTVPRTIDPENMEDTLTVRFRVGAVYQNAYIDVYFDDKRVSHIKRPVLAPGEMEKVVLRKSDLLGQNIQNIKVEVTQG